MEFRRLGCAAGLLAGALALAGTPAEAQTLGELLRKRAREAASEGQLDEQKQKRMHQFLASAEAEKRAGAYAAMRKLGEDYRETYGEMLVMAKAFHRKRLVDVVDGGLSRDRSVEAVGEVHRDWDGKRAKAVELVRTDWKAADPGNYGARHKEMDVAFGEAEAAYGRLMRAVKPAGVALARLDGQIAGPVAALGEISRELAWCDGREGDDEVPDAEAVLEESGALEVVKAKRLLGSIGAELDSVRDAAAHNTASGWAGEELKAFAGLLNGRRAVLGMETLRLDERLSAACAGHSQEMARLGYFAHESPVEENRNFGMRARNHAFEGQASGECIYRGGGGANGSHTAWWYSDGHRLIMYMDGANTLGLGVSGQHWTLNTGRKDWGKR